MKYQPRNPRITIWEHEEVDGELRLKHSEMVEREDFTEAHLKKILSFFDAQERLDKSFNKTKAIHSTFVIVEPTGQQSLVTDDEPEDTNVAQIESEETVLEAVEIPEDLKAEYKELYGRNPRSDWSIEKIQEKINEKKTSE